jgi:probable rRNA maturation factor
MDPASTSPARAGIHEELDIIVADRAWHRIVPRVRLVTARAARAAQLSGTILLTDDRSVRRLNARDRGRNKPTNVLSYDRPAPGLPGQIVLAAGVVRREAAAGARPAAHHLSHLVVHGALHLAGHDHLQAGMARRMELAEARILRRIGVPNPWKPRG